MTAFLFGTILHRKYERRMGMSYKQNIPISEKLILSQKEAAAYSGIGINRLSELLKDPDCPFAVRKGSKTAVKRQPFEEYIRNVKDIG